MTKEYLKHIVYNHSISHATPSFLEAESPYICPGMILWMRALYAQRFYDKYRGHKHSQDSLAQSYFLFCWHCSSLQPYQKVTAKTMDSFC